jgi:outer membrane lipoprotein-sorting protein
MAQVVAAYHSISTYSDLGSAIVRFARSDLVFTVKFETLFKRPGRLRFAWTSESNSTPGYVQTGLIWCDGTTAWKNYSFQGGKPEQKKSLDLIVAGATGASSGTAHHIPRLLSDEVTGTRLDELQDLKITGKDTADGVECIVVVGFYKNDGECKVWIGREDHFIRRIEERSTQDTQEQVRTRIVVNQEISDSRFSEQGR